jgi:hypothetical protein
LTAAAAAAAPATVIFLPVIAAAARIAGTREGRTREGRTREGRTREAGTREAGARVDRTREAGTGGDGGEVSIMSGVIVIAIDVSGAAAAGPRNVIVNDVRVGFRSRHRPLHPLPGHERNPSAAIGSRGVLTVVVVVVVHPTPTTCMSQAPIRK